MMQSTDKKISNIFSCPLKIAFFVHIITAGVLYATTQLQISGGSITGERKAGSGQYNCTAVSVNQIFYGSYSVSPDLRLILGNRFSGIMPAGKENALGPVTNRSPLTEKMFPSSNQTDAGLQLTKWGEAQVTFRNILYQNALPIAPYYLDHMDRPPTDDTLLAYYGSDMARQSRIMTNLYWSLPLGRTVISADVNYVSLQYLRNSYAWDLQSMEDVMIDSRTVFSNDLWSNLSLSCLLFNGISTQGGISMKQNFSGHTFMNLYHYNLQLEGSHSYPADNKFIWTAGSELYQRPSEKHMSEEYRNSILDRPIPELPLFYLYLRDVYTLGWGLFIKGNAVFEAGKDLIKGRYEISFRKAWENYSFVEPGYNASFGGLFPVQTVYLRSSLRPVPAVGVNPSIKVSWEGPDRFTEKVSFMKAAGILELSYEVRNGLDFLLEGDYTYYNTEIAPDFPGRFGLSAGIRSLLP